MLARELVMPTVVNHILLFVHLGVIFPLMVSPPYCGGVV
jgi:hypothetical protein